MSAEAGEREQEQQRAKKTVHFPPSTRTSNSGDSSTLRDEDDDDDFDREMAMSSSLLGQPNGMSSSSSRRSMLDRNSNPLRSLTTRRIALIAGFILFALFFIVRPASVPSAISRNKQHADNDIALDRLPDDSPLQPKPALSRCTPPKGQKERTYALMIDAGSTGSRIHVYTFRHCDPSPDALPKLEHEGFYMTKPGLSSYKGRPREAAESLRGLMDHAMEDVPASEHSCTPVAVKATAGLRLLGQKQSQEILDYVESWLKKEYPFSLVDDGVVVMDGKDEGVYAWITINFLLGLIGGPNLKGQSPSSSAAVMDLGGASTQIVFEPSSKPLPGAHVYDLDFSGKSHVLYQHSHLGYGLMQARRAVHNLVAFSYVWSSSPKGKHVDWDSLTRKDVIPNPCMHKGQTKVVTLDPPGRTEVEVTMSGTGSGFEACRRIVEVMLAKDALCEQEPCAFAGVYQPSLRESFSSGKVWALSYFYDRIAPLGLESPFLISDLRDLTNDVCKGPGSRPWKDRFVHNKEAMLELDDRPEYCLDLTFMYTLLSLGYDLDDEREIWIGKKVDNVELGWALGAALAMVNGHLSCRAD